MWMPPKTPKCLTRAEAHAGPARTMETNTQQLEFWVPWRSYRVEMQALEQQFRPSGPVYTPDG